jgi:hypothetical protein
VLDPQEVGDGNQELTDRMSRTGGATAQRALRVRFDFTTSITPRAVIIDRQWKANELGVGLDVSCLWSCVVVSLGITHLICSPPVPEAHQVVG